MVHDASQNYAERLNIILGDIGCDSKKLEETLSKTKTLLSEVIVLCGEEYTPKFELGSLSPKSSE